MAICIINTFKWKLVDSMWIFYKNCKRDLLSKSLFALISLTSDY